MKIINNWQIAMVLCLIGFSLSAQIQVDRRSEVEIPWFRMIYDSCNLLNQPYQQDFRKSMLLELGQWEFAGPFGVDEEETFEIVLGKRKRLYHGI